MGTRNLLSEQTRCRVSPQPTWTRHVACMCASCSHAAHALALLAVCKHQVMPRVCEAAHSFWRCGFARSWRVVGAGWPASCVSHATGPSRCCTDGILLLPVLRLPAPAVWTSFSAPLWAEQALFVQQLQSTVIRRMPGALRSI